MIINFSIFLLEFIENDCKGICAFVVAFVFIDACVKEQVLSFLFVIVRGTCDEIFDIDDFFGLNFDELLYKKENLINNFQLVLYFYLTDYDSLNLCPAESNS